MKSVPPELFLRGGGTSWIERGAVCVRGAACCTLTLRGAAGLCSLAHSLHFFSVVPQQILLQKCCSLLCFTKSDTNLIEAAQRSAVSECGLSSERNTGTLLLGDTKASGHRIPHGEGLLFFSDQGTDVKKDVLAPSGCAVTLPEPPRAAQPARPAGCTQLWALAPRGCAHSSEHPQIPPENQERAEKQGEEPEPGRWLLPTRLNPHPAPAAGPLHLSSHVVLSKKPQGSEEAQVRCRWLRQGGSTPS